MSASKESKLEIMALGYDHYRILRDSAAKAEEYLNRVIKRGGKPLAEEFWFELPNSVSTLSLTDLANGLVALVGEMVLKMADIKEHAQKLVIELKLTKDVDSVLYDLAEAQRKENKKVKKQQQEIAWLERHSKDEMSVLDTMQELPVLGPDQAYEYLGIQETKNGKAEAVWEIISTPLKTKTDQPKVKTIFHLRQRPKT